MIWMKAVLSRSSDLANKRTGVFLVEVLQPLKGRGGRMTKGFRK